MLMKHNITLICDFAVQIEKTWSAQAARPYDPYLTPKGEEQVGRCVSSTANCSTAVELFQHHQHFRALLSVRQRVS